MAANINNLEPKVKPFIKKTIFAQIYGVRSPLTSFFIMFLLALSFGFGLYALTALKSSLFKKHKETAIVVPQFDLEEDVDVVHVLLLFHAADYFIYRGVPIGFQYEMLKELERKLGRNVDIKVAPDIHKIQKELSEKSYDIVVMDFTYSGFLPPFLERSIPHSYSYPVLVAGNKADTASTKQISVSNDFHAKLFFAEETPYTNSLIQKSENYSTEELFEKVDAGEISYLICDYNQAITLMPFYSNVQILEKAGPQFERCWLLNKKNVQLNEDVNHWLLDFKKTPKYSWFIRKYFSLESSFIIASFAKKQNKGISLYDAIIKKYAEQYEIDWRFVASIICQETKFIPGLTGKGGSYGLMQLMPVTMEYYGISESDEEEVHIRVGIQQLNLLRKSFDDVEDDEEKLYFMAAAYNAGRGHIFDAQRLCAKFNDDFTKWTHVAKYLKLKSQREFATDSVVKSGYFPGLHAVRYAQQVMERYSGYKAAYP